MGLTAVVEGFGAVVVGAAVVAGAEVVASVSGTVVVASVVANSVAIGSVGIMSVGCVAGVRCVAAFDLCEGVSVKASNGSAMTASTAAAIKPG